MIFLGSFIIIVDNFKKGEDVMDDDMSGITVAAAHTKKEDLYEKLINQIKSYHPSSDFSLIQKAYEIGDKAHEVQKRKSGEPYITHPLSVAIVLAELELDMETIIAGILHDVVEDTTMSVEEVAKEFGEEIAHLVDGVTKLTKLNLDKVELQAENLRKMFLAMAKDIRVILIKLADRLHNMRTMQYQSEAKQYEKAKETMDIYAPIAQRLGISKIKIELDDLALKYLEPETYHDLVEKISQKIGEREEFIVDIVDEVNQHITDAGIEARVKGRVKHFFSIYRKMIKHNKTLDQIYDLFAVRIVVDSVKDCYAALGVIHEMYKPIPGRFKDYVAMPKPNMYQSLHTTLISSTGQLFEVQIRTFDMHRVAEYGIAAHWKYKVGRDGEKAQDKEEEKLAWLRQILEWQQEMSDNREFMSLLKNDFDLFSDNVFCFTPTGDVKNLPAGSTPVDFAYLIHTAVGNKMVGARVNNRLVPLEYEIQNGDQIEVLTSQNSKGPSRDWLKLVKSTQAKNKINQWFKNELKEENITRGKELIIAYCKTKSIVLSDIQKPEYMEACMRKYGFRDWDSICAAVGHGGLKEGQVVNRLAEEHAKKEKHELSKEGILLELGEKKIEKHHINNTTGSIIVNGLDDMAVHFSKCCAPVPGDEILGFVTRGRGLSIHRTDCINILSLQEEDRLRLLDAEWNVTEEKVTDKLFLAEISIFTKNRKGVLLDVAKILSENDVNISSINSRVGKREVATVDLGFEVNNVERLNQVIAKLRSIPGVLDIKRSTG